MEVQFVTLRRRRELTLTMKAALLIDAVMFGLLDLTLTLIAGLSGLSAFRARFCPTASRYQLRRLLLKAQERAQDYLTATAPSKRYRGKSACGPKGHKATTEVLCCVAAICCVMSCRDHTPPPTARS